MVQYGTWSPYTGFGEYLLAFILLLITGALIYLATRLRKPITVKGPGRTVGIMLGVIWFLSILSFLTAGLIYATVLVQQVGPINLPPNPVTPVTLITGGLTLFIIVYLTQLSGFTAAVGSAVIGAIVAWMTFELPFDLIVMWRTYPPKPQAPFTLLYFLPLLVVEITSFALLTLSPLPRLSRSTLLLLASMFLVFAIWALFGFAYPETPIPIALNMIGKILAFAIAISLFLPDDERAPWKQPQKPPDVRPATVAKSRMSDANA